MAENVLVDAGFLVALLSQRDRHHVWARAQAARRPPPWHTCEAALSEAFHLLGAAGIRPLATLLARKALRVSLGLDGHIEPVIKLLEKYRDVPAGLADAVLVRMTEVLAEPLLLTTDRDFLVYRRHGRQVVPVELP